MDSKPNPAAPVDLAEWSEPAVRDHLTYLGGKRVIAVPPGVLASLVAIARWNMQLTHVEDCNRYNGGRCSCGRTRVLKGIRDTAGPGGSG